MLRSFDLICLSHLRWDFVYQRPQHLLSRCAREHRVFFIEEPVFDDDSMRLEVLEREQGILVVVPHLPECLPTDAGDAILQRLLDDLLADYEVREYVLWYYTPMAMGFTEHLSPLATVYDCMDELSAFKDAPAALRAREAALFARADLVFTGGQSLYEVKRTQHPQVYLFPSSVDTAHFGRARMIGQDPADQAAIPGPRLGFFGVIDERMDLELVAGLADARPAWHLVMVGPVVKIDPASLPHRDNIHYLGAKSYQDLPGYLAGWDAAILPFARNESTRFISPTKTPEYLAAGKPVVSTSIRDVVRPYGERGLVRIADNVEDFVAAVEMAMGEDAAAGLARVDGFLAQTSWDCTWSRMAQLIETAVGASTAASPRPPVNQPTVSVGATPAA